MKPHPDWTCNKRPLERQQIIAEDTASARGWRNELILDGVSQFVEGVDFVLELNVVGVVFPSQQLHHQLELLLGQVVLLILVIHVCDQQRVDPARGPREHIRLCGLELMLLCGVADHEHEV
eukprot:1538197-Rhodomonas_salina.2